MCSVLEDTAGSVVVGVVVSAVGTAIISFYKGGRCPALAVCINRGSG